MGLWILSAGNQQAEKLLPAAGDGLQVERIRKRNRNNPGGKGYGKLCSILLRSFFILFAGSRFLLKDGSL